MSGHSHWATTHRQKGLNDAKRAAIFTKVGRIVTIAAKGGGNPDMNFKLRLAIDTARSVNMPKDRIDRAIAAGTGEAKEGALIEELLYEAYGPGQVAMLIGVATDNRNRSVGEIKTLLTKNGGKMVTSGAISFLFEACGEVVIDSKGKIDESLELALIESGADNFERGDENSICVYTKPEKLKEVEAALQTLGLPILSSSLSYLPSQKIELSEADLDSYEKLRELLEDNADVQRIWDNL